jgi:hypothetical protein
LAGNKRNWSVNESSDRKWWQRSQLYPSSAITSDQCTYFDSGDIAERHSVASSFLACHRFQIGGTSATIGAADSRQ